MFFPEDIGIALDGWFKGTSDDNEIALWHSHPSGFVGPSEEDLRCKVEAVGNLIVSIVEENHISRAVFTWY